MLGQSSLSGGAGAWPIIVARERRCLANHRRQGAQMLGHSSSLGGRRRLPSAHHFVRAAHMLVIVVVANAGADTG